MQIFCSYLILLGPFDLNFPVNFPLHTFPVFLCKNLQMANFDDRFFLFHPVCSLLKNSFNILTGVKLRIGFIKILNFLR